MDQRIINLFDEYTHKPLRRDEFLLRLAILTGSMASALSVLPKLEVNYENAETTLDRQDEIITEAITYPGKNCTMKGYLARPKKEGKFGSVVVIHENRGLNPHIEDVTRRAALAGFVALAPDALSPQGGTPANEDEARGMFSKINAEQNNMNFMMAFDFLKGQSYANGKNGCIGFCWGGAMANQMAVHVPDLKAAVPFYGRQPDAEDVPKIKAFVQAHYGELDERVNAGIPAYEAALKQAKIPHEIFIYKGANHAFHNDTAPTRYDEAAAKLAWGRAMELFRKVLA